MFKALLTIIFLVNFAAYSNTVSNKKEETPLRCFDYSKHIVDGYGPVIYIWSYHKDYRMECPKDVVIPSTVDGVSVGVISSGAFNRKGITSVILPENLTHIMGAAFKENQITSVVIPKSVEEISYDAFLDNKLTSVTFHPEAALKWISFNTFKDNELQGSIFIPNSVGSIGHAAFWGNKIESVEIPSHTTLYKSSFNKNVIIKRRN
ncbi:MAG: leucine-rich repeat domain-containing protein [Bdellovibrionaceae bacterium]|jgi:hypothetical protein|nr:leucine-rich repeat domain-containing protein [Pseudobdellovibrionaceae bacterium]